MEDTYEKLREQYPEIISKEQLYQICHISKRKAVWLLEHGVIPCEDSGRKTHRFRIRLDDVIEYLRKRDDGAPDVQTPIGAFTNGKRDNHVPLPIADSSTLYEYLLTQWQQERDLLDVKTASELCGCCMQTLHRWLRNQTVEGICYHNTNFILKDSLARHLASNDGQRLAASSERYRAMLKAFSEEQETENEEYSFSMGEMAF